ncbi:MAG: hypothetical protein KC656_29435 [Myxococcales bacterium]|nr:hypothetical protein [Myxococcales bacterium]MCB9669298.1 hypothetical protein [Alphaproteobacteria bacterium]MCB9690436.1 hypothetical protein [Alphaproteobacteria bacterium]
MHVELAEVGEPALALESLCEYLFGEGASKPPLELRRQLVEACQMRNMDPIYWDWLQESLAEEEE